jgi:fumarate hydratase class II
MKIANDVRWYASGPRTGIGELKIPAVEAGSSIMPGKVNPTQCEALAMVAVQVFGNDHAIAFAGSQGSFQLNTYKPVILHNILTSITLLSDACDSFRMHCASGIEPNLPVIAAHLGRLLMLATALSPHIGYDKVTRIVRQAAEQDLQLREAAIASGFVSGDDFDRWVQPETMLGPLPSSPSAGSEHEETA